MLENLSGLRHQDPPARNRCDTQELTGTTGGIVAPGSSFGKPIQCAFGPRHPGLTAHSRSLRICKSGAHLSPGQQDGHSHAY